MPPNRSLRPGWPSLKITTAEAPAAAALSAFCRKVQVPRWISATLPAGNPAKSLVSQPLVELGVGVGGMMTSTAVTPVVTSPEPE